MNCPVCQHDSRVTETRAVDGGVRRRRECVHCRHRWTTLEIAETSYRRYERFAEAARGLAQEG